MKSTNIIEHEGLVKKVTDDAVIVGIIKNSGCTSCQAKGNCNISEVEEKEIEVAHHGQNFVIGEAVNVFFRKSLGFRALFLGYILPFLLVLLVLVVMTGFGTNEGLAGLISLGALIPYYIVIYFVKGKLKNTFSFSIEKN